MRSIAFFKPGAYAIDVLRLLLYKGASLTAVIGDFVLERFHIYNGALGHGGI